MLNQASDPSWKSSVSFKAILSCVALAIMLSGCKSLQTDVYQEGLMTTNGEPAYITVQHCLISFQGVKGIRTMRTKEEAEALALELFEKAKAGEDFDRMVKKYTDDSPPGVYRMANHGQKNDMSSVLPSKKVYSRREMVAAFGDTGFPLDVGQYGMSTYDPEKSPYGWHIVKRLK